MERRDFLRFSALGMAGTMIAPGVLSAASPAAAAKKAAASDKINMGFIGLGRQCMYLMSSFIKMPDVKVVAGCDVYDIKRARFEKRVKDYYTGQGEKKVKCDMYEDYQELLARPDIDAVVIATPDHWHALVAIEALKNGKDVYLEKPMTLTVYEGQMLCKAVRKYNRILQVGSMQRASDEFLHFASVAREGLLGKIDRVKVYVSRNDVNPETSHPRPCKLPKMDVPAGLNWDKWLGPLPTSVYYHSDLDPLIDDTHDEKLWGAWRWYKVCGGGLQTDWGAHMFDIAQWALGKDQSGPVEIIPAGHSYYEHLTYKYDNGIIMTEEPVIFNNGKANPGVQIYGEGGWIRVMRGGFESSDPKFDKKVAQSDLPFEVNPGHHRIFIDSVKSRIDPNCPVEVGHSSCTVCNLGNIADELGRPLKWNPIVQKFMNDEEATKLLHYDYRPGYKLEI